MEKVGRLKRTIRKLALLEHKLEEKTIQLANQEHHDEGKVYVSCVLSSEKTNSLGFRPNQAVKEG